jgi:hypothetical protein
MLVSKIQEELEDFDKIHLEEMDRVQLMNRVDTKFTFSIQTLIELLPLLNKHYKVLEVEGTLLSAYESLYYDDHAFTAYKDHHRRLRDRFKVRYRKYVNSNIAFLEIKHKKNGRTEKSRIRTENIPMSMSQTEAEFVKNQGLNRGELQPSLMNRFKRITLVNKTINERLTLDVDLTFEWEGNSSNMGNVVIAELKQERAQRTSPFYALMKKNLIRPLRISKYCIGMIELYGKTKLKYNRFKKKLLYIQKIQKNAA